MQVPKTLPTHVSIIMDGNGRWARERGKERVFGHAAGVESVRAVMEAAVEWGIPYVSFFAFSEENWGRPEAEVSTLMELMARAMLKEIDNLMEHDVRFIVLGNLSRLSDKLRAEIEKTMAATAAPIETIGIKIVKIATSPKTKLCWARRSFDMEIEGWSRMAFV